MTRTKATLIKKVPVKDADEEMPIVSGIMKQKIPVDFGYEDSATEEKTEDAVGEDGEDLAAEELSLDEEELNPFGDKWEE
jgi:hypothetical protein